MVLPDSRLRPAALHFVNMPPERFDWSDHRPPQASPSPAGLAPAGLAEASPSQGRASGGSTLPDLVVRTRRSDYQLKAGTTYRIGRDPKSDIVMTDSRVSWQHGVLRVDGDAWIVEDLDSTNGTFLGLQRLDRIEIGADCVVRLGNPDDGPVLRCMPQVPAAAVGQPAAPPANHPGTALSASPARPPRPSQKPPPRPHRAATPSPGGSRSRRPDPCRLPAACRLGRSHLNLPHSASLAHPASPIREHTPRHAAARSPVQPVQSVQAGPAAERGPQAHGADAAAGQGHAHRPDPGQ